MTPDPKDAAIPKSFEEAMDELESIVHAVPAFEPPAVPLPGFSWVVEGELAAMPLPGRRGPLAEDLSFLHQQGVRILISLTELPPDRAAVEEPTQPERGQIDAAVRPGQQRRDGLAGARTEAEAVAAEAGREMESRQALVV